MFSLICVWINSWANNEDAGDLGRHRAHYEVIVMTEGYARQKARALTAMILTQLSGMITVSEPEG